jgi:hypothetical protein
MIGGGASIHGNNYTHGRCTSKWQYTHNIYNRVVRYQENEGIVLKLVPNVSSKLSTGCVFSICFVLHVAGLNSPLIFYWILERKKIDHVAVEMIGLFDITDGTFNQPIQNCNTGAYPF